MSTQTRSARSLEERMHSRARIGLFLAFCASVGAHGVAYASLSVEHRARLRPNQVSEVSFELPPLPTAEPEPPSNPPQPAAAPTVVAHAPPSPVARATVAHALSNADARASQRCTSPRSERRHPQQRHRRWLCNAARRRQCASRADRPGRNRVCTAVATATTTPMRSEATRAGRRKRSLRASQAALVDWACCAKTTQRKHDSAVCAAAPAYARASMPTA